ncbi:MAG: amidophosphoribosyltransferase, partial [Clostridiales bacterium]|nr:amidophosphoribosyltransferase [Clostridiales bacterium]
MNGKLRRGGFSKCAKCAEEEESCPHLELNCGRNEFADKLHEECAVFGVSLINRNDAPIVTYNGLVSLQHRGQEGAGIASIVDGNIDCFKKVGLVGEVFSKKAIVRLPESQVSVGHTRYSTTGANLLCNVQPIRTEYLTGRIATSHNGNVINALSIKNKLKKEGVKFSSTTDSEVISSLIA